MPEEYADNGTPLVAEHAQLVPQINTSLEFVDAHLSGVQSVQSVNGRVGTVTGLAESNDPRFTNARPPTAHTHPVAEVTGLGNAATRNVGTLAGTVAAGDDTRLSNARTPTAHQHAASDITSGVIAPARLGTGTRDGTKFLRDDGAFAVPPAGSGGGGSAPAIASQAEAQAGTDNTKMVTPLRVRQFVENRETVVGLVDAPTIVTDVNASEIFNVHLNGNRTLTISMEAFSIGDGAKRIWRIKQTGGPWTLTLDPNWFFIPGSSNNQLPLRFDDGAVTHFGAIHDANNGLWRVVANDASSTQTAQSDLFFADAVATLSQLRAIPAANRRERQTRFCEENGWLYYFDPQATDTDYDQRPDDVAAGAVGRWEPVQSPSGPQPYDLSVFVEGKPGPGARIFMHYFKRAVRIQAVSGEVVGKPIVLATDDAYMQLVKNAVDIGNIWASGGPISSEEGLNVTFAPGDVLQIFAPDPQDATLADFCFTLPGVLL